MNWRPGGGAEDRDYRVVTGRAALDGAQEPATLTSDQLREELTVYRKYTRWLIDLADDAAGTEYDEEASQVMIYGGVYIAPADYFKLCDACMKTLDIIWDSGVEPCQTSAPAAGATSRS